MNRLAQAILITALIINGIQTTTSSAHANTTEATQETSPISPIQFIERSDDELLIIRVKLGQNITLEEAMIAYLVDGKLMLPLSELVYALEFPIDVNPELGYAEGWFLKEGQTFKLEGINNRVIINGEPMPYNPARVELHEDDVFVDADILKNWFGIKADISISSLTTILSSEEPLPIEQKLMRERVYNRLSNFSQHQQERYPIHKVPYNRLSWPSIDVRASSQYQSNASRNVTSSASALMTGDLLFHDNSLFVSGSGSDGISSVRWKLSRTSDDKDLLGPLKATHYEFGDIFSEQLPLVATSQGGRGVAVSNFPINRVSDTNTVTLRGDIAPEWEVELYRNDTLLQFQTTPENGQYEFADVPLLSGLNIIKLVFHGPYGERREEVRRYLMDSELLRTGKKQYSISVMQHNRDLIDVEENEFKQDSDGRLRIIAQYEQGIDERLSFIGNFASTPLLDGEQQTFVTGGLKSSLNGVFGSLLVSKQVEDKGIAFQANVRTIVKNINVNIEHNHYKDVINERTENISNPLIRETNLRLNSSIKPFEAIPRVSLGLTGAHETFKLGNKRLEIGQRTSTFIRRTSLSHFLRYNRLTDISGRETTQVEGDILASLLFNDINLRGEVNYAVEPTSETRNASISGDYEINDNFKIRFGVDRQFTGNTLTTLSSTVSRKFREYILGLSANYNTNDDMSVGVNMSFSLGRNPNNGAWAISSEQMSKSSLLAGKVYMDYNQDKIFNEGDEPLENIGFRLNGAKVKGVKTDENGIALVPGMTSYNVSSVTLDQSTFEDPFWMPTREGAEVIARPGHIVSMDFPVVPTGEVDGTVFLRTKNRKGGIDEESVSRAKVQLINNTGEVVMEETTAFDGFYLFSMVPLGEYTIRINPEQLKALELEESDPITETLTADELVLSGMDIVVQPATLKTNEVESTESDNNPDEEAPATITPKALTGQSPAPIKQKQPDAHTEPNKNTMPRDKFKKDGKGKWVK